MPECFWFFCHSTMDGYFKPVEGGPRHKERAIEYLLIALGALVLAELASAAPKWDPNGDGQKMRDKFAQMISSRAVRPAGPDKDGGISLCRMERPSGRKKGESGWQTEKRFAALDGDKDGILTNEECQIAQRVTKAN